MTQTQVDLLLPIIEFWKFVLLNDIYNLSYFDIIYTLYIWVTVNIPRLDEEELQKWYLVIYMVASYICKLHKVQYVDLTVHMKPWQ